MGQLEPSMRPYSATLIVSFLAWGTKLGFLLMTSSTLIDTCPQLPCDSTSEFHSGFFTSQSVPGDLELGSSLIAYEITDPFIDPSILPGFQDVVNGAEADGRQIVSAFGTTSVKKCTEFCNTFKQAYKSSFWTFSLEVLAGDGADTLVGKCYCYTTDVCISRGVPIYDDRSSPLKRSTTLTQIFVSGSLCTTEGHGDPYIVDAAHSLFDLPGAPNNQDALIGNRGLEGNDAFDSLLAEPGFALESDLIVAPKTENWIRKVSISWNMHTLALEVLEGFEGKYGFAEYMQRILLDGHPVFLSSAGESAKFELSEGTSIKVTWLVAEEPSGDNKVDKYEVSLGDVLTLVLSLKPNVEIIRSSGEVRVFFGVDLFHLSVDVRGVVGQTHSSDFVDRLEERRLMSSRVRGKYMEPGDNLKSFVDNYLVSDILVTDPQASHFVMDSLRARKLKM